MSFSDVRPNARQRAEEFTTEAQIFGLARLARVEIFSQLSPSELGRFCDTGRLAALAICGIGNVQTRALDDGGKIVHALVDNEGAILDLFDDLEIMPEIWQAFLARDYGISPQAALCSAFSPYERNLVALSFLRYTPAPISNLRRLRRLRRLYIKLWQSADRRFETEPDTNPPPPGPALPNTDVLYARDGIVLERSGRTVLMSSVVALVAAELAGLGRFRGTGGTMSQTVELFKGTGDVMRVIGSPFHTGAYLIMTTAGNYAVVMRDTDFWTLEAPRNCREIYVDAREPDKIYFADGVPLQTAPYVVDLALTEPEWQQLQNVPEYMYTDSETGEQRSASFFSPTSDLQMVGFKHDLLLFTNRFAVAYFPALGRSAVINYNPLTGRGHRVDDSFALTQVYLVPTLNPGRNDNEQKGRFGTTVLYLCLQYSDNGRVVVERLRQPGDGDAPAVLFTLSNIVEDYVWRVGPTTALFANVAGNDFLLFDWATGQEWPVSENRVLRMPWLLDFAKTPLWLARPAGGAPADEGATKVQAKILEPIRV